MQGMCNRRVRFQGISIGHLDLTPNYLAFATSSLHSKLENPEFLALGLVSFSNNTYVANNYIVTPFKNTFGGNKDAYNFYHS